MENQQRYFVISDAKFLSPYEVETGFWTGTNMLSTNVLDARRYGTLEEAEDVVQQGDFYDPMIREVEFVVETLRCHDMYQHGRAHNGSVTGSEEMVDENQNNDSEVYCVLVCFEGMGDGDDLMFLDLKKIEDKFPDVVEQIRQTDYKVTVGDEIDDSITEDDRWTDELFGRKSHHASLPCRVEAMVSFVVPYEYF